MTTGVTPALSNIEDVFGNVVWDNLVDLELEAFFSLPCFAWCRIWPIGPIIRYVVHRYSTKFYARFRTFIDITVIKIMDTAAKNEFEKQALMLKVIEIDRGLNSQDYKDAKEKARTSFLEFIKFRGV